MNAELVVGLLRRVRHDYANHLQVISGYLQLGQPEQVQEYLVSWLENLEGEKLIFTSLPAPACLYFYEQLLKAYDGGITLRFEDIELESWEILKANGEPGASLQSIRPELERLGDQRLVFLSIYEEGEGIDLLYSWDNASRGFRIDKG